jgi:hypothetical protein
VVTDPIIDPSPYLATTQPAEPTYPLTSQAPVEFWPPVAEPVDHGLLSVVDWEGDKQTSVSGQPDRFLINGVRFRTWNYGSETSSGVWDQTWCLPADGVVPTPGGAKLGTRPGFPPDYQPITPWASDYCDLTPDSTQQVELHAEQWLKLNGPIDVERAMAVRYLSDAGALSSTASFLTALGTIEAAIAATNIQGYVHAPANVAPLAANAHCLVKAEPGSPWRWETPCGNPWIFGGGYGGTLIDGSDYVLIATSKLYGWKGLPQMFTTVEQHANQFVAVAEQSFCIGYESLIGSAVVTPV